MRLRRYFLVTSLIAACSAMTGCGAPREYDNAANRDVSTIALLDVDEPRQFQLVGSSGADRTTLTASPAYRELSLGRQLTAALEAALMQAGYQIVHVTTNRQRPAGFLDDYSRIRSDADAILDVAIDDAGYARTNSGTFVAYIVTKARLVKLPQRAIVYSESAVTFRASGREATVSRDASGAGQSRIAARVEQQDVGIFLAAEDVTADPARSVRPFGNGAKLLAAYYAKTLAR